MNEPERGVDFKMATSSKGAFKEFYPKLLEIIPISHLITQFYSRTLLSHDHKGELDAMATDKEKAKYFLDKVIKPGLQIDYTEQFDEMLLIMQNSDDPPVKYLADEVTKFMKRLENRTENTGLCTQFKPSLVIYVTLQHIVATLCYAVLH